MGGSRERGVSTCTPPEVCPQTDSTSLALRPVNQLLNRCLQLFSFCCTVFMTLKYI